MSDDDLIDRTMEGDSTAFNELVARHGQAVYRAALAALGSPADAEDVMQDAFVLAFRKLRHFRRDASFKTWLLTITWRRALRLRHSPTRRLQRLITVDNDFWADSAEHKPSPEQTLIAREIHRDVRRLIRALPSRLRDPLLLAASGRYTYDELSSMLGTPTGTIKWQVSEARRVLRMKLERLGHARTS